VEFEIKTGGASPVRQAAKRIPFCISPGNSQTIGKDAKK